MFGAGGIEERLDSLPVRRDAMLIVNGPLWHNQHTVHRPRSIVEEGAVPGAAKQHDLCLAIGGAKRLQGGQGEDEIAQHVGAQHAA